MKKLLLSLLILMPFALMAQDGPTFQEEFSGMIAFNSGRVLSLAEAIPADKYTWSPSEGVRDVSGVIAHVTGANYFFASGLGFPAEGFNPESLAGMSKEDAIATMKASYDQIILACKSIKDENLADMVEFGGGQKYSKRSVMFIAMGHVSEHMGQMVAYARSNDIAPPWSAPAEEE